MLRLCTIFLILNACADKPIKLDCEWEIIELRPGEVKAALDMDCMKKIREMQIKCGNK